MWKPFELRPEGAPPLPQDYIDRAWKNSIEPMSQELGVTMTKPGVSPKTTRLAHEAAEYARTVGKGFEMSEEIFKAHFQESRDISRMEVLCDLALKAGLDPVELRGHLEQRTYRSQVEQQLMLAQRYGISAVPTFIVGNRYLLQGLVSEEQLLKVIGMCRGEGLIRLEE